MCGHLRASREPTQSAGAKCHPLRTMRRRHPQWLSCTAADANGDYELENCTWATAKQQARNTRRNRWVLVDGREMIVSEAKRILRHSYRTLMLRIARGEIQEIVKYPRPAGTLRHR